MEIALGVGGHPDCEKYSAPLLEQLATGHYEVCSVLALPVEHEEWREAHRTARKRADRSRRLGYSFTANLPVHVHSEAIFEINSSLPERQGRRMSEGYRNYHKFGRDPEWPCPYHRVYRYGVGRDGKLFAYLWLYRSGQLALVSQILGHGAHLKDDIMYLLGEGAIADQIQLGLGGYLVYNRHDSGSDGLRYFKEKLGFGAETVEWAS